MLLPTNSKMYSDISELEKSLQPPNWNELLDPKSTFRLYYSLQIIETFLPRDQDPTDEKKLWWQQKFLTLGGFHHLLQILMNNNFQERSRGTKRKICLELLLKLINHFVIGKSSPLSFFPFSLLLIFFFS
jgi:hypothetical protein